MQEESLTLVPSVVEHGEDEVIVGTEGHPSVHRTKS